MKGVFNISTELETPVKKPRGRPPGKSTTTATKIKTKQAPRRNELEPLIIKPIGLKCEYCGKTKKSHHFNRCIFNKTGYEVYCKECKNSLVTDKQELIEYLELNNMRFSEELWDESEKWIRYHMDLRLEGVEELPEDINEKVMKKIVNRYYSVKGLNGNRVGYHPDDKARDEENKKVFDNISPDDEIFKNDGGIIQRRKRKVNSPVEYIDYGLEKKWGKNYNQEEYEKLEGFYQDMKANFEIETAAHIDYLKKICKVSVQMDKALEENNIDVFQKLSGIYDKLMHSAKFTAVQRSASDRTGGMNTIGEIYDFLEKNGFIPKFYTDEPLDIVDITEHNLKEYTKKLVLGDTNIANIIESSIQKIIEKEELERNNLEEDAKTVEELEDEDEEYESYIKDYDYEVNKDG